MNLIRARQWHLYLGLLTAPSVLFFSLTGAVQLLNLHEAHGNYRPAALIEKLSSVHKDQVFALGHHFPPAQSDPESHPQASTPHSAQAPESAHDQEETGVTVLALKGFFLFVAIALCCSTALGLWMSLTPRVRRPIRGLVLAAGVVIPVIFVLA